MIIDGTAETVAISRPANHQFPGREDCWSEDASYTLIEAWGDRYLELNRGNLRHKHWQEVADAVNARHGAVEKSRRTDVQCKNRMDTLKKKYKLERARVLSSGGTLTSSWPFYSRLDSLIGISVPPKKVSSPVASLPLTYRKPLGAVPYAPEVKVGTQSATEKRPLPLVPRNYSAVAAAAAAAADSGLSRSSSESRHKDEEMDGVRELAQAIVRFGEIYERVEEARQRQLIELEKQRMDCMKSLEFERMQLFMDTQVELEKIKRAKRAVVNGERDSLIFLL
ncbi:hypothetical protein BVC80_1473g3 [Macleaya cordata]|uniref:Myb/SANT-like DNA-binding domain-containing protein n=1 Tax=Macleaya cordata TaxID=56857 RepID=A0A200PZ40_MACCD|nr:hypothetical protein BVC80_1473g3 [Macleaya cordata]